MISGGYYIKARQIQESEISHAPPHVREIWDYLLKEANHKDVGLIKRGSTVRSLKDMQEALSWYVGYRKESYSKSKCEMAMNWLRKRGMITTTKTTRGMIITICKYDHYQNPKSYETNNEICTKPTRNQQTQDTINKNVKNVKKEKNIRANEFKQELIPFKDQYGVDLIKDFFEYWTEANKAGRMRFEMEKTWEMARRLSTWYRRSKKDNRDSRDNTPSSVSTKLFIAND